MGRGKLSTNKNMVAATFRLRKEVTVAASFNLRKQTQAKACGYQLQEDQKALTLPCAKINSWNS